MMGLEEAESVDLAKRAEELVKEAERLREQSSNNSARSGRVSVEETDAKLATSIRALRRMARV